MIKIYRKTWCMLALLAALFINKAIAQQDPIDRKGDSLLAKMTLAEKIGQMNQYNGDWEATGPVTKDVGNKLDEIRQGRVGSVLNIMGTVHIKTFQDAAMQSRLKIPLLFGQ